MTKFQITYKNNKIGTDQLYKMKKSALEYYETRCDNEAYKDVMFSYDMMIHDQLMDYYLYRWIDLNIETAQKFVQKCLKLMLDVDVVIIKEN